MFEKVETNEKTVGGGDADVAIGLSADQLTNVIERMGQLVLGVKTLFDSKCAAKKTTVLAYDVPGKHSQVFFGCSFYNVD